MIALSGDIALYWMHVLINIKSLHSLPFPHFSQSLQKLYLGFIKGAAIYTSEVAHCTSLLGAYSSDLLFCSLHFSLFPICIFLVHVPPPLLGLKLPILGLKLVCQTKCITDLLVKVNMVGCNPVDSPASKDKLSLFHGSLLEDPKKLRSIVGAL